MTLSATPIVLLHGWGFTPEVWNPLIAALEEHGIERSRMLAPVLPLQPNQSLSETLAALSTQLPDRAHIVGWSLGGELALALAQTHPNKIASLTMISSTPCFMNRDDWSAGQPTSLLDDFDERLATNPTALLKRFATLIRHGDAEASRDRALSEHLALMSDQNVGRLSAGLALLRDIDLRASAIVHLPYLLIHGTHDAVTPLIAAEFLAQTAQARLHRIDNASHVLPLTHPTQIATHLSAFFEQHP